VQCFFGAPGLQATEKWSSPQRRKDAKLRQVIDKYAPGASLRLGLVAMVLQQAAGRPTSQTGRLSSHYDKPARAELSEAARRCAR